jgi:diacylglycerol O-acyltransferase / wax synthase
MNNLLRNYN